MAEEQSYVNASYVDLCGAYASPRLPQLTTCGLLYYKLKNTTFGRWLLLHHHHVAVFVQRQAVDLLARVEGPANRPVDARTFVKIRPRLLALRDVEMQPRLRPILLRLRRRENVAP